jgi:hypothetical protein
MSLVTTTSLTCERVTGEGSGFRGAKGTGGTPGVGVHDSMNSGNMPEDPGPTEGVRAERGDRLEGGGGQSQRPLGSLIDPELYWPRSLFWREGEGAGKRKLRGQEDQTCT